MAFLLVISPWLLAYDDMGAATWSAVFLGIIVIIYSLCTRYECAVYRVIPMGTHLVLDGAVGLALVGSPWVLGFVSDTWLAHVIFGGLWIVAAVTSQTVPVHYHRRPT
ncbi:MAG: SPW repeat protein [Phycisphaeraceae bacterium]